MCVRPDDATGRREVKQLTHGYVFVRLGSRALHSALVQSCLVMSHNASDHIVGHRRIIHEALGYACGKSAVCIWQI